jgi:hypothetical protein
MMRATVATTRFVRNLIGKRFDQPLYGGLLGGLDGALSLFTPVLQIAKPGRRLPDGRTMAEFAPDRSGLQALEDHVRELTHLWAQLFIDLGPRATLTLLACLAARWCWRWWLTPTWPHVVAGFVRQARGTLREVHGYRSLGMPPPSARDPVQLGHRLLAGPDRLSAVEAAYVVRAGLGRLCPQDCELSPVPRDVPPREYLRLVVPPAMW